MIQIQYKNTPGSPLDVDTTGRRVKVVISEMGSKDLDQDVIDVSAYNKTIQERGPKGANLIWHLTDHNPSMKYAIGKFSDLSAKGNQLVGVTNIPNTSWGNDMLEFYKTDMINQHSVGFSTVKSEDVKNSDQEDSYRLIKEIKLYEGSAVLWGANPNTPTLEVGKSATKKNITEAIMREMDALLKCLRGGKFTDEAFELIELRFKQLQSKISIVINHPSNATSAVIDLEAQEPDEEELFPLIDIRNLNQARGGSYGQHITLEPANSIRPNFTLGKSNKPGLSFAEQLLLSTI